MIRKEGKHENNHDVDGARASVAELSRFALQRKGTATSLPTSPSARTSEEDLYAGNVTVNIDVVKRRVCLVRSRTKLCSPLIFVACQNDC